MAAAAILNFAFVLTVLYGINCMWWKKSAYQISLRSDYTKPSSSDLYEISMAATAILNFAFVLPVLYAIDCMGWKKSAYQMSLRCDYT